MRGEGNGVSGLARGRETLSAGLTKAKPATKCSRMHYNVSTFYTDAERQRHPWKQPFTIPAKEFAGYRETARDFIESLLDEGQPDGPHPIGLEIADPTGKLVFTYVRPAPSED